MSGPRQMLLNIRPQEQASLDNFVVGANAELLARVADLADPGVFDQVYVWGPPGSGRSHLLRAAQARARALRRPSLYVAAADIGGELAPPPGGLLIVDDVDALGEAAQIALFRVFNAARLVGLAVLLSGAEPPLLLELREDLRTRIGAALVYEIKPLSDGDKAAALRHHAAGRGMPLEESLIDYLLRHGRRDLPSLLATIDQLDRVSLEMGRAPSLPLLRELMHSSRELAGDGP